MQSATLTRPRPVAAPPSAVQESRRTDAWAWAGLLLLCIAATVGFFVYPTYPNYDSYYSMLWGRELLDGQLPVFETYRAPTPHPLATAIGALISPLGHGAERLWIALCVISFVALVVGVFRLAREAFTPLVGLVAARWSSRASTSRSTPPAATSTSATWRSSCGRRSSRRRAAPAAGARAGPARHRRAAAPRGLAHGRPVLAVGRLAGPARPRRVALFAVLAAIGPSCGRRPTSRSPASPLYSLTYTSGFAEELGRAKGAEGVPSRSGPSWSSSTSSPCSSAASRASGIATALVPRRIVMPLVLLVVGIGTFGLVGAGGFSVIDRYLLVTSMMVMIFCAVALGGWTMLREGTFLRRAWAIAAALLVVYGVAFTATRVNVDRLDNELVFRGDAHAALHDVLNDPAVRAGLRCGPVNVPNHKLIPDIRWISDLPDREVLARSETAYDGPDRARRRAAERTGRRIAAGGVSIIPHQRAALFRQALVEETDDPATVLPLPGYERRAVSSYYAAYVRCP
jgi:hypothetical protein